MRLPIVQPDPWSLLGKCDFHAPVVRYHIRKERMRGPEHHLPLTELEPETRSADVCTSYSCFEQGLHKLRALDDPVALASILFEI